MSLKERKQFGGVPDEMHSRGFPEALARAAGLTEGQDTSKMGLADIAITAYRSNEQWHVFIFNSKNPPSNPDDVFGSFTDNDVSLTATDILNEAETWIRDSENTEWVPGRIVEAAESGGTNALGFLLVRAPSTT